MLVISSNTLGQGRNEENSTFVFESNLPDELYHFYQQEKIESIYFIRKDINPFYLRGDFDGDQKQDFALGILDKKTGRKGILIYHTGTKNHYIIGAGRPLPNGNGGDDLNWMDAWKVFVDKNVEIGVGETKKITLKGEAILAIKTESASGIIYWTGREYRWYQQGD